MIKIQKPNFIYSTFEVTTFDNIYSRLSKYGIPTFGGKWSNVRVKFNNEDDYIYLYHAEKHRKKVERKVVRGKKVSTIISRGHWKVRVYRFRKGNVISSVQHKHHFTVVLGL